jgi:catechol 2,3-dioxygenase-like lactoylglutathione lyase family enzyme
MKILAVDHVTINCVDISRAKRFYEEVLGLPCLSVADLGDHVLHYYPLAGGVRLELIAYKNPQKTLVAGNTDTGVYRHVALRVDDLDALHTTFLSVGVPINLPPTWIPQISATVMLAVDPNGVEMEFIQDTTGKS